MTQQELEQSLTGHLDLPRTFECEVRVDDAPRLVAALSGDAFRVGERTVQRSYTTSFTSVDPGSMTLLKATGRQLSSATDYEVNP